MNDDKLELKKTYTFAVENQQKGNLEIAENSYLNILKQIPNHMNTRTNLGGLYLQMHKYEKASSTLKAVLKIEPFNIHANSNLGLVYSELSEYLKAIACHKKVIDVDSNHADTHNNLGRNYKQLGQYDLAKKHINKAIKINPNHANAYNNLGTLLKTLGENEKAIIALSKALQINPNFLQAQLNLSNLYLNKKKNFKKATEESYKALKLNLNLSHKISNPYGKNIQLFRLKHDYEQSAYLKKINYPVEGLNDFYALSKEILSRKENLENENNSNKEIFLKDDEVKLLMPFNKTVIIYNTPTLVGSALNPEKDWKKVENDYLKSKNEIMYIDKFLSDEAIKELRNFSLISKVWIHQYNNKYLGAFSDSGFISPLHFQIGTELQKKLPNLFGKYEIEKFWGFKYDTTLGQGIGIHADFAFLNLNFWITPDEFNNDKTNGGLKVYDAPAPNDWTFDRYNGNASEIYNFLKERNAKCEVVPYKFNRAVLFNSAYFHETDKIDFKKGYESRRINITYLFGTRKIEKEKISF